MKTMKPIGKRDLVKLYNIVRDEPKIVALAHIAKLGSLYKYCKQCNRRFLRMSAKRLFCSDACCTKNSVQNRAKRKSTWVDDLQKNAEDIAREQGHSIYTADGNANGPARWTGNEDAAWLRCYKCESVVLIKPNGTIESSKCPSSNG